MLIKLAWRNEQAPKHNFPSPVSPNSAPYSSKGVGVALTPKDKIKETKSGKNGQQQDLRN